MSTNEDKIAERIREVTEFHEAEREEKKKERLEKKRLREIVSRRERREKWVAPVLLILTAVISYILFLVF